MYQGSPPHTWRIQLCKMLRIGCLGITSTYVENTKSSVEYCWWNKDHLHIRGEYSERTLTSYGILGSPPHTWRIPKIIFNGREYTRITSTYVENTRTNSVQVIRKEDHLHIRGEYMLQAQTTAAGWGSPPHTWRIHRLNTLCNSLVRITSTYVENTRLISKVLRSW